MCFTLTQFCEIEVALNCRNNKIGSETLTKPQNVWTVIGMKSCVDSWNDNCFQIHQIPNANILSFFSVIPLLCTMILTWKRLEEHRISDTNT